VGAGASRRIKQHPGSLTPAPGTLVELSRDKSRAEFLEYQLASFEEARERQKRQWGRFFTEQKAWLDSVAEAVRPAVVKFFAHVLFRAHDGLQGGRLVRRASREELAEQMRMHENTVRKATKVLVAAGKLFVRYRYNEKTRRNQANEYYAIGYVPPRKKKPELDDEKMPF
jgi:hypothetical protein